MLFVPNYRSHAVIIGLISRSALRLYNGCNYTSNLTVNSKIYFLTREYYN